MVWLHRLADGMQTPLVTRLASAPFDAGGFGYYGAHPSLFTLVGYP